MTRTAQVFLFITSLILFFTALLYVFFAPTNVDEIAHLHVSWHLYQGHVPYVDFFDHHHHLFHWLITPLFFIGGESLLTVHLAEYFAFAQFLVLACLLYLVAKRVYNSPIAILSVVIFFCLPEVMSNSTEVRPDVLSVILIVASIYFHLSFFKRPKFVYAGLVGLFLALAFLASQKAGFLAAAVGFFHLYLFVVRKLAFRHFAFCWGIFSFVILIGVAWLYHTGALSQYDEVFFTMTNWGKEFHPFLPFKTTLKGILRSIGWGTVSIFFLHGLLRGETTDKEERTLITLCALTGIGMLFLIKIPHMHNFLYFLPFFSMIAVSSMFQLFHVRKTVFYSLLSLFLLTFLSYSFAAKFAPSKIGEKAERESLIEYSLSVTDSDDLIYDGNFVFNIFRKDLSYLWYGITDTIPAYVKVTGYNYDVYDLIEKRKPKIISDAHIDMTDSRIANHYELARYHELSKCCGLYIRKDERVE